MWEDRGESMTRGLGGAGTGLQLWSPGILAGEKFDSVSVHMQQLKDNQKQ